MGAHLGGLNTFSLGCPSHCHSSDPLPLLCPHTPADPAPLVDPLTFLFCSLLCPTVDASYFSSRWPWLGVAMSTRVPHVAQQVPSTCD